MQQTAAEERSATMRRFRSALIGFLKRRGPRRFRVAAWDTEFRDGHWDGINSTASDYLYGFLERYVRGGALLDLGCGGGNTGNELAADAYSSYEGMDISQVAVDRARARSQGNGRAAKNVYAVGDLLSYEPSGRFDVVLFRESLYYVPKSKIPRLIAHYAAFLKDDGVFVVRMWNRSKHADVVDLLTREFEVLESALNRDSEAIVVVFRPRGHQPRHAGSIA
jgi:2-polyprenyl-3-methyl-5-hydroxy-6-metoxy-1,4-benzoquinol methylase